MRSILSLLACFIALICHSQTQNWDLSKPVDIKETGVNKVLCMKNGNTMLLHFEINKQTIVKIFDSTHKEISSEKHIFGLLDATRLQDATFKGLYDINGEAVLFIEQERLSKYVLIRLRFDGSKGTLIEEKIAGESPAQSKRTTYYVMKNKNEDNYAILFSTDMPLFNDCNVHVTYYNQNHEVTKDVAVPVDRKRYDRMSVIGAQSQSNGICLTLLQEKMIMNATAHLSGSDGAAAKYDHHVGIYFIPNGSNDVKKHIVNVTSDVYPYLSHYTYNSYASTLNVLLLGYIELSMKKGVTSEAAALSGQIFFKLDEEQLNVNPNWLVNNSVITSKDVKRTADSGVYKGIPVKMFTNQNGLSTVFMQSYLYSGISSELGYISVVQLDDDGKMLFGGTLSNYQFVHYPGSYAIELAKKTQTLRLFGGAPAEVYERQFCGINVYEHRKDFYIVYNDYSRNFNDSLTKPGERLLLNFPKACYYKIDRAKKITKHYLLGEPATNEYTWSFVEGADFDEQRGVYVTLVQHRKGDNQSLRMGWAKLE